MRSEIGQRARRHDRGQLLGRAALERRRAHRHAVGVGRGHRQHAVRELDEDAGEDGAGVVARGGAQHALAQPARNVLARRRRRCDRDRSPAAAGSRRRRRCAASSGWRRTRASAGPGPRRRPASTCCAGRWRTMSSSSRPGTTTRPGSCTSARSLRAHRELHVRRRQLDRARRTCASISTPERICTLERCDTPRATTWRCLRRSSLGQEMRTAQGV